MKYVDIIYYYPSILSVKIIKNITCNETLALGLLREMCKNITFYRQVIDL